MERTILTGALLVDGTGTPPVSGRAVVVEDGRIAAVVASVRLRRGRRSAWTGSRCYRVSSTATSTCASTAGPTRRRPCCGSRTPPP